MVIYMLYSSYSLSYLVIGHSLFLILFTTVFVDDKLGGVLSQLLS